VVFNQWNGCLKQSLITREFLFRRKNNPNIPTIKKRREARNCSYSRKLAHRRVYDLGPLLQREESKSRLRNTSRGCFPSDERHRAGKKRRDRRSPDGDRQPLQREIMHEWYE